jgi:hypothetical protein
VVISSHREIYAGAGFIGWCGSGVLEGTVASVNSALQRARATLKEQLPKRRLERTVPRRYMLWIEAGRIAELTAFHDPGLFPAFALPTSLPPTPR